MEQENQQLHADQQQLRSSPSKTFLILIAVIILVVVSGGAYFLGMKNAQPEITPIQTNTQTQISPTQAQVNPVAQISPMPTSTNPNVITYTSPLGISFTYLKTVSGATMTVKESGNKICVTSNANETADTCAQGQYVQVFQKTPSDSIQTAITKQFLTNYSPNDCFASLSYPYSKLNLPSTYQTAVISFPQPTESPNGPWWQNASKCPTPYTTTNGVAYFLEDTTHPDKLLFFSIGQYPIMGDNNKVWNETVTILN